MLISQYNKMIRKNAAKRAGNSKKSKNHLFAFLEVDRFGDVKAGLLLLLLLFVLRVLLFVVVLFAKGTLLLLHFVLVDRIGGLAFSLNGDLNGE